MRSIHCQAAERQTGAICGIKLPAGLREAEKLPAPIFTPATKAPVGEHDENISFVEAERIVGADYARQVRDVSLRLYAEASAYAASKHGLIGLMRTVAKEAAPRRVRVNVVAPGPIDNDFQRGVESGLSVALGTDAGTFLDSVIPLGRHARAEEVAETVLFLASDKSSFTTGSVVMADGGMHV